MSLINNRWTTVLITEKF